MVLRRDYVVNPQTLYIGGGTPSLYPALELGDLIDAAQSVWSCGFKEITVEVNPEDVTPEYVGILANCGVNRLSVGIQSFFDEHLRFMNRRHSAEQGIRTIQAARDAGFSNISMDLIFGFPGLSITQWRQNIRQALALNPEHLSVYSLSIEPGTPFDKACKAGLMQPVAQEAAADQYALLQELLPEAGLGQYEVSNFAREGYRAMHNTFYWQGVPYLGLGPSAHSFSGVMRHANVANVGRYIDKISKGEEAVKAERLMPSTRYNEFIMTRLRTASGFSRHELELQKFGSRYLNHFEQASSSLLQRGLLHEEEGRITIPSPKWFVSDGIIVDLLV